MAQAIEVNSVRRGYDPREFTLVAAGGAGPLFACDIAVELEIPRVLVPPHPGITSATGLLATDLQHEFVATERHFLKTLDRERLGARLDELAAQAAAQLERDGVPEDRRLVRRLADCRYVGQGYEVRFDVPAGELDDAWTARLAEAFHAAHEREYGHRFDAEIEIVNVRALGIGRIPELRWAELEAGDGDPARAKTVEREVVFDVEGKPERRPTPFYDRELLRAGDRIEGPAVVEQYDSTTVIPPGFVAEIDRSGNIVIDCSQAQRAEQAAQLATPILMRVIGGAFAAIAKEMAGVLYRMSYSSIIRESEDLGAGIFDPEGNELAESDSTPMFMGAMPKIVKGVISLLGDDIHDGRRDPAQRPVPRRDALAGRRDRDADLLRRRARRASPARRRTCSTSAAPTRASRSTSSTTGRRATSTARSSSPSRACARTSSGSTSSRTRGRRRTTAATSRR